MAYPAWKDMTSEQKFEYLHEWCTRITRAVQSLGAENRSLHERLRAVEAKVEEIAAKRRP